MDKCILIGTRCKVAFLLENFQGQYAVLDDIEWDGADVDSGVVIDIIPVSEYREHQDRFVEEDYYYEWLGEDEFGGYIDVCGYTVSLKEEP